MSAEERTHVFQQIAVCGPWLIQYVDDYVQKLYPLAAQVPVHTWRRIGGQKPQEGTERTDGALLHAFAEKVHLGTQVRFTVLDLDGVADVHAGDFVRTRTGDYYATTTARAATEIPWVLLVVAFRVVVGAPWQPRSIHVPPPRSSAEVAVREAHHFGTAVGAGAFAAQAIPPHVFVLPFTGRVHVGRGTRAFLSIGDRVNYILHFRYGARWYTIDPTDAADAHRTRDPAHVAAAINEPSAPVWPRGARAWHSPSAAYVYPKRYVPTRGHVVATDEWMHEVRVAPDDIMTDAQRKVSRANCSFQEPLVPLEGFYEDTGTEERLGGQDTRVFARTSEAECTLEFATAGALAQLCSAYANLDGLYDVKDATFFQNVRGNDTLELKYDVYNGLRREGTVLSCGPHHKGPWRVRFFLQHGLSLPARVPVAQVDGRSVPLPSVYSCAHISAGDELLCLYSSTQVSKTRGLGCKTNLPCLGP